MPIHTFKTAIREKHEILKFVRFNHYVQIKTSKRYILYTLQGTDFRCAMTFYRYFLNIYRNNKYIFDVYMFYILFIIFYIFHIVDVENWTNYWFIFHFPSKIFSLFVHRVSSTSLHRSDTQILTPIGIGVAATKSRYLLKVFHINKIYWHDKSTRNDEEKRFHKHTLGTNQM